jgi:hypothetical protein
MASVTFWWVVAVASSKTAVMTFCTSFPLRPWEVDVYGFFGLFLRCVWLL